MSWHGGFVDRRSSGVCRPRVRPSGIHGSGAGPIRTGTSASGAQPAAVTPTAPGTASASRTRISRATTSRPGRWTIAVIGLRREELHPVLQLMRAVCSPVHHAAMGREGPGVRRPLVRFERTKAPLLEECQTHSGVSGRLPLHRNIHRENSRRAPAASHPSRTPRTVVPISSGCWVHRGTHRPSRERRFSSMLRRRSRRRSAGARNRTGISALTVRGRILPATPACGPARSRTGIRASSVPRSQPELRVRGRGRIRTCDRLAPPD